MRNCKGKKIKVPYKCGTCASGRNGEQSVLARGFGTGSDERRGACGGEPRETETGKTQPGSHLWKYLRYNYDLFASSKKKKKKYRGRTPGKNFFHLKVWPFTRHQANLPHYIDCTLRSSNKSQAYRKLWKVITGKVFKIN